MTNMQEIIAALRERIGVPLTSLDSLLGAVQNKEQAIAAGNYLRSQIYELRDESGDSFCRIGLSLLIGLYNRLASDFPEAFEEEGLLKEY